VFLEQAGSFQVQVFCVGAEGTFHFAMPVQIPQQNEVELDLEPPLALVRGRVVDEQGRPIQGVRVSAETGEFHNRSDTRSRPDGRYELSVSAGVFTLVAGGPRAVEWEGDGYAPERLHGLHARAGETLEGLDFLLGQGARLKGRVRFEHGSPASEAGVRGLIGNEWQFLGACGDDGRFELDGVDPAVTRVQAQTRSHASAEVPVALRVGATSTVELVLAPR
jgi:hypothetical protein